MLSNVKFYDIIKQMKEREICMNKSTFNEQIKKAFLQKEKMIEAFIKRKTNAFIESIVSENYIERKIKKDCIAYSKNWWLGKGQNYKKYALHIDYALQEFDIEFGKELEKASYEIIHIIINKLTKEVYCYHNDNKYTIEELIINLDLKENINLPYHDYTHTRHNIIEKIINWLYNTIDLNEFIFVNAIERGFITRFFKFTQNLDIVWANEINNEIKYFIGEVKFKSTNYEKVFQMNIGEKINYQNIINNTNINIVAIATISNKKDREDVLHTMLNTNNYPIFYCMIEMM